MLVLRDVCKAYSTREGTSVRAASHVSLEISAGESIALTGESGSGKSTLLNLIALLERPDSGDIELNGESILGMKASKEARYRQNIGYIFQSFNLIDSLTIAQNVAAALTPQRKILGKKQNVNDRVREALEAVSMAERASAYPHQLSGGQRQRVAIARALATEPWLILADEPTGNLDSENSEKIITLLLDAKELHHSTLIVATHSQSFANRLHRQITLRDGAIVTDSQSETS